MDAARITPPRRFRLPIDNRWGAGDMSVLDFGDAERPADLVFVHANGFNAGTYRSLLAPLGGALRVLAPDLRGHGQTRLPTRTRGRFSWHDHRDDLIALLDSLDGPPVALAGHSMGGTAALLAAAERPEKVSGLILFDPVIWPRAAVFALGLPLARRAPGRMPLVRSALRRRVEFPNRQAALAAYRGRGAFRDWPETMLADYVADGFVESGDGVRLICDPAWEASNYASQSHDPYAALAKVRRPVRILRAAHGSTCHLAAPPRGMDHIRVDTVPDGTHFIPMLRPDVTRDALFEAAT